VNGSTINLDNGALTPISTSPWQVPGEVDCYTFDSSGTFLFACDLDTLGGNSGVHAFQIDQNSGALALVAGSPFVEQGTKIQPGQGPATVGNPSSIVIGPSGNFLYAFNGDECALSNGTHCPKAEVYRINRSTGALQVVYPEPLPVPDGSGGQIQHPNGEWVYAAGGDFQAPGQIVGVMLDDTAVTVTALPNMPVSTGLCPAQPAFNDDASRLYVVNRCDTTISVFKVNADGSLTLEQTPVVAPAGFTAFSMAVVSVPQ
jgi:6-phosphogluconolactonase (cycloisomerase 2 family)